MLLGGGGKKKVQQMNIVLGKHLFFFSVLESVKCFQMYQHEKCCSQLEKNCCVKEMRHIEMPKAAPKQNSKSNRRIPFTRRHITHALTEVILEFYE